MDSKNVLCQVTYLVNAQLVRVRSLPYPRENISPDELILVIGTTKTNRWAIAVNVHESAEAELAFVVRDSGARVWGEWSRSMGYEKCGPHVGK